MDTPNNKRIVVNEDVVVKKSPECKSVSYKANASMTQLEAIEKFTVGEIKEEINGEETQS